MNDRILIGVLVAAVLAVGFFVYKDMMGNVSVPSSQEASVSTDQASKTSAKVTIEDLVVGTGNEAKSGDTVVVQYKGTLENGTQFDSSYDRGEPLTTKIGTGAVIQGWDQGIPGMKVGGKRKLTIPSELGYGQAGAGDAIPPNSTLIFEVELVEVK